MDKGVDLNTKGAAAAVPPLLLAALNGHMEVAKLLIANGANVNAWDGYETPLDVSDDESEFAELLRKHGGNITKM